MFFFSPTNFPLPSPDPGVRMALRRYHRLVQTGNRTFTYPRQPGSFVSPVSGELLFTATRQGEADLDVVESLDVLAMR